MRKIALLHIAFKNFSYQFFKEKISYRICCVIDADVHNVEKRVGSHTDPNQYNNNPVVQIDHHLFTFESIYDKLRGRRSICLAMLAMEFKLMIEWY